VSEEENCEI